jgi:AP2 domain
MTITLSNGGSAKIDRTDYDLISPFKWCSVKGRKTLYAAAHKTVALGGRGELILMHRLILGARRGEIIDHVDDNGLNNTRKNIRILSNSLNILRQGTRPHSSKFRGVSFIKGRGKWLAFITVNRRTIRLGRFSSEEEAARVRDRAVYASHGPLAILNFPLAGRGQ